MGKRVVLFFWLVLGCDPAPPSESPAAPAEPEAAAPHSEPPAVPAEPETPPEPQVEPEDPPPEPQVEPEGQPPEPEAEPEVVAEPEGQPPAPACMADRIDADALDDHGMYRIVGEPNGISLGGCQVSDGNILRGADSTFVFTAPRAGEYHFIKQGRATMVSVHASCDFEDPPLACAPSPHYHDPDLGHATLWVTHTLAAGQTVYVNVNGYQPRELGLIIHPPSGEAGACGDVFYHEADMALPLECQADLVCLSRMCSEPPPPGEAGEPCGYPVRCVDDLFCHENRCGAAPEPSADFAYVHFDNGHLFVDFTVFDPAAAWGYMTLQADQTVVGQMHRGQHRRIEALDRPPRRVSLLAEDGRVIFEAAPVPRPLRDEGEACSLTAGPDRCAPGTLCAGPEDAPRCVPVEVLAWTTPEDDGHALIEIRGALSRFIRVDAKPEVLTLHRDESRWIGRTQTPVDDGITVNVAYTLVAEDVEMRDPPARAAGEACDPHHTADRCPPQMRCIHAICQRPQAPIIEEAVLVVTDDRYGIWVRGEDPNGDIEGLRIGDRFERRFGRSGANPFWYTSAASTVGQRFEGFISDVSGWRPHRRDATMVLIDAEGLESEPFPVDRLLIDRRPLVEADAPCDLAGALFPCADGLVCATADGTDAAPTCQAPVADCPMDLAHPLELGEILTIRGTGPTSQTRLSCGVGNQPSTEHYFNFTAPEDGGFHVRLLSTGGGHFGIRSACLLPTTEVDCPQSMRADHLVRLGILTETDLFLQAGETITVVVKDGDQFDLLIERN